MVLYYLPVHRNCFVGGGFGLEKVPTDKFGGFMLNLIVGLSGIVLSLPVGILLALGRQLLPLIRWLCVAS